MGDRRSEPLPTLRADHDSVSNRINVSKSMVKFRFLWGLPVESWYLFVIRYKL